MKLITKFKNEKGHIIITCEKPILFGVFHKTIQFIATEESPKGYWNWKQIHDNDNDDVDEIQAYELDNFLQLT